jgi:DNA polymerase-3 subunit epsilon
MRQIVLDTETTGISPKQGHRIIEIGCVEMIGRQLTGKHYHVYINPERVVEEGAIAVHGITNEFLADKPLFSQVVHEFIEFIRGAELIIHNAPFDVGFMDAEFMRFDSSLPKTAQMCQVTDTLVMAREKHPGQQNNLDALCKRYYVDNSNRDLHGALVDADLLAGVYLAMTGGQTALFAEAAEEKAVTQSVAKVNLQRSGVGLPIVEADQAELARHQAFMQKIE